MARIGISLGPLTVEIEDEDKGFKPLAREARALVLDLSEQLTFVPDEEEKPDGE